MEKYGEEIGVELFDVELKDVLYWLLEKELVLFVVNLLGWEFFGCEMIFVFL